MISWLCPCKPAPALCLSQCGRDQLRAMVVDSFLLIPSLLLLVAGVSLLTASWRRQGSDRRQQWWMWWLQVMASKSGAERQAGRHRSPRCRPHCSQQQASGWKGNPILPHPFQPGKTRPLLLRSACPSLHMDSATGTMSSVGKPGRLPRQDQRPQVLVARGIPRTLSQRPRRGGGVEDLPPEISNFTKPPVKGTVFQEGLVHTEERKRWWDYETKRLFWRMHSPALPKVHRKAGAAARPSRGPALSLGRKADGKAEARQPFNSGFSEEHREIGNARYGKSLLAAPGVPKMAQH
ncbi:uncharacterized protein LOC116240706 [Phasianus colchicus]|uniref:uncharacterized protein LOC116240706 n=1 Tax=Phasianus colchicus TaxID=9054 RepID=UPI00129D2B71|nr:uncharacterized protein LOC116240706 [Phasianus colchicus]